MIHRHQTLERWLCRATLSVSLVLLLLAGASAAVAAAPVEPNVAGSRDTLALYDFGARTGGIYTFVNADGALSRELSWKSAAGGFDVARAKFAAGDVNGDGRTDGIALYNLGRGTSCLYVFVARDGGMTKKRAWKSTAGGFAWSRAKLAVGDVNADGRDDVVALYDLGKGRAALYRFISRGSTFSRSLAYTSKRGALYASRAQLAAGDATGDSRADAIVLYRGTPAKLWVFASKGSKLVKSTFWQGAYQAGAKLAAGDVDSDGDADVLCARDSGDARIVLDAFLSDTTAFAPPATWWTSAPGSATFAATRVACGDLDADGRADAVLATSAGTGKALVTSCRSTGAAFESGPWWTGTMAVSRTRPACAPARPLILTDQAEVLGDEALDALTRGSTDGTTFTFDGYDVAGDGIAVGDVIVAEPSAQLPYGALRKVTAIGGSGGDSVVTTEQATLEDVVEEGELQIGGAFTQDDVVRTLSSAPGVRLVPVRDAAARAHGLARRVDPRLGFAIEIDTKFKDGGGEDLVKLNGTLEFDQSFGLSSDFGFVRWSDTFIPYPIYGVTQVKFTSTTTQTTALRASLQKTAKKEVKQEIASYQFATFVVMFGPVPVTFTPELSVYIGASGEFAAGITARVTQVTTVTTGLQWTKDNGWGAIKSFSASRTFDKPQLFGSLELKAFAGLELMLKIYQLAGPTGSLEAYLGLFADTLDSPWWKLSCGVDAKVGVKVEALSKTLFEHEVTIPLFEKILDQAAGAYVPKGAVSGEILCAGTTTGVDYATVELRQGAANPTGAVVATTTSGDDGWYSFAEIAAGEYTVVASKTDFTGNSRSVTVTAGVATGGQDVELTPLGVPGVSGTVTEYGTATPLSGVTVDVRSGYDKPGGPLVSSTTTGAGGTYQFTPLVPGDYTVVGTKSGYFAASVTTPVATSLVTGQDIALVPVSAQGVSGRVFDWADGGNVAGATVTLHEGYCEPDGPVWGTTTSAADGTYSFEGVPADQYSWGQSYYTAVATKPGYVRAVEEADVLKGAFATGVDLGLATTDGTSPAKADSVDDTLVWPGAGLMNDDATYELWWKPTSAEPGHIAQISFWYGNFGEAPWAGTWPTMYLLLMTEHRIAFGINEEDGGGPGDGTWHQVIGTTQIEVGQWYHIAAQNGSQGMKLFVNGHLEASDPYTGRPEADWSDATLAGGCFALGDNDSFSPLFSTARGEYKWLRVSHVQRYWSDFTPPAALTYDGGADVFDQLLGGTNGWNRGFVWTP